MPGRLGRYTHGAKGQTDRMTATSTTRNGRKSPARRGLRLKLLRWSRRYNIAGKAEVAVAVAAIISGIATYAALSQRAGPVDIATGTVRVLLLLNVILLLTMAALIARRVTRLWMARRKGIAGSRLHGRIVGFFSLIAVGPPILMAIFSALFLDLGLQAWFSEKVRNTINESQAVAEAYVQEHRRVIAADIRAMANDLNRQALTVEQNHNLLQLLVEDQVAKRALSEAIVFDSDGNLLAHASMNLELAPDRIPLLVMERLQEGELVIISETDDDRVRALVRLDGFFDAFLYVSRFVDATVLSHVESARAAVQEYESLEGERSDLQTRFNLIFLVVALLVLMAAVWIGLWFATQLVGPISRLVEASEKVAAGDMDARVPESRSTDEIGTLSRAFNRMMRQLRSQQKALVSANHELDERRRFTEAVLSGVSAGVISMGMDGVIRFPNTSASEILGRKAKDLEGLHINEVLPGSGDLLAQLQTDAAGSIQRQISLEIDGSVRTLLLRISAECQEGAAAGYVATFDDITEQLADQRTAAWADVARRIAHEIKNPLTPIQLSAERLKRKYGKEIASDPAVFEKCTDTIIRQVGDLRHMVDEFSSFARMPVPVFRAEDMMDIVRQTVFLQEVAHSTIEYTVLAPADTLPVHCDGRLISQALTNLLKNAAESIQAARSGNGRDRNFEGQIAVEVRLTDAGNLRILVRDNGRGFPKQLMERLTEPYVTTRTKGTGLGLAIVRKIMEDHRGTLSLRNRQNGGAEARLDFSSSIFASAEELKDSAETLQDEAEGRAGYGA